VAVVIRYGDRVTEVCLLFVTQTPERAFVLRVSYMEIYNESLTDLFGDPDKNVEIRQDKVSTFSLPVFSFKLRNITTIGCLTGLSLRERYCDL